MGVGEGGGGDDGCGQCTAIVHAQHSSTEQEVL